MLAKLISHGAVRAEAAAKLASACAAVCAWPVKTNAWFLTRCLRDPKYAAGRVDTDFIEAGFSELTARPVAESGTRAAGAAALTFPASEGAGADDPWARGLFGFRIGSRAHARLRVHGEGAAFDVELEPGQGGLAIELDGVRHLARRLEAKRIEVDGRMHAVWRAGAIALAFENGAAFSFSRDANTSGGADEGGDGVIRAPMPGRIVAVAVDTGEDVAVGQALLILEAMKMEHTLKSPIKGRVAELAATVGTQVVEGAILARLEGPDAAA
jgi:propionyl-CoA carboxylase alpha chain/3-methylcrotonyl-CoA carboxylase alpha subunit